MTKLLVKLFVPNHTQTSDPKVRSRLGALSGTVGICCNLTLFAFKLHCNPAGLPAGRKAG